MLLHLDRAGNPLASLKTWRVASPTTTANTKAGLINSMSYTHDDQPENSSEELFGEVISTYTDDQALEDGVLVELRNSAIFRELPINRMTRHLFDDLLPFTETEMSLNDGDLSRAIACILRTKCRFASADPGNIGEIGDIYRIPPKLWLVRNEVGGWTAMYPKDY